MERDTLYVDWVNPHQAVKPATFIYDDCLYMMGGSVKERVYSDKVHTLDLKTGVWYDTGTDGRCKTELFYADGKLYLVGGNQLPSWP